MIKIIRRLCAMPVQGYALFMGWSGRRRSAASLKAHLLANRIAGVG